MHVLRLRSGLAGGLAGQAMRRRPLQEPLWSAPTALLQQQQQQQQQRRTAISVRKGEEGRSYNNGNNMHRTTLSAYEVMAAKLGRFDRPLEALHIDGKGQVTDRTTSIKELLLNTEMHVRDLMALSPDSLHKKGGRLQPCILPRGDVIIFVMHPVRLVISKDSCLAFDPGDLTVRSVIADIASAIKIQQLEHQHAAVAEAGNFTTAGGSWEVAYELIVLEQALRSFCNQFARIYELLSLIVDSSLTALVNAGQGNEEQLFKLVPIKDGLATAHANMQEAVDVLLQLLNSDEDMLGLMLTEQSSVKKKGGITCLDPALHSEVELLLENYHRQLVVLDAQIKILRQRVQSAQEVFAINVDLHRNRVLRTTLFLTILSTSFASAATVASFLGMNVHNGLENHPEAFTYLVGGSCCLGTALFLTAYGLVRGQGRDRMRQDLNSVQAYQAIFKHIRSVSQAIFMTAMDPLDKEMGPTPEFREHFRKLLSEMRHREVSFHEVDILIDLLMTRSADAKDTSVEEVYRKLFDSLGMGGSPTVLGNGNGNGKAGAAAAAAGTEPAKKEGGTESDPTQDRTPKPS